MAGKQVRRSVLIDAAPQETWPWLADVERELRWRAPQVVELKRLDGGQLRPGSRFGAAQRSWVAATHG